MLEVIKRNGEIVDFDLRKISNAIEAAFKATETTYTTEVIQLLSLRTAADFQDKINDERIDVEVVQDSVERVLASAGYEGVAKAYILYRKQREKMRRMKSTFLDYCDILDSYVKTEDWSISRHVDDITTVGSLMTGNTSAVTANYWLSEIYDEEIVQLHYHGDFFLHDLGRMTPCSAGWSLKQLIQEGISGVRGMVSFGPARHLSVLCSQMADFLHMMQSEWAGAQTLVSFDTYLAPFVRYEQLDYEQVRRSIESFLYALNLPDGWGSEMPFSNLILDWNIPAEMEQMPVEIGGEQKDFTYGSCQKEMDMINRALLELMIQGDYSGNRFRYPLLTYSLTDRFEWDSRENSRLLFKAAGEYGIPCFANFINNEQQPAGTYPLGRRLFLDPRRLQKESGGVFASRENTGSIGLVTINLARAAYQASDEKEFFRRLDFVMDQAARSLKIKRDVLAKLMNEGLYPMTQRYLGSFDNHFSSIGIIGMNEACLNASWIHRDLTQSRAQRFARSVLLHMRDRLKDYQEKYGDLYSLEATQSDVLGAYLAGLDRKEFPDILVSYQEDGTPYYTDSSHLPQGSGLDPEDTIEIQDEFQMMYTSGTVFTLKTYPENDWRRTQEQVRYLAENSRLPFFQLAPEGSQKVRMSESNEYYRESQYQEKDIPDDFVRHTEDHSYDPEPADALQNVRETNNVQADGVRAKSPADRLMADSVPDGLNFDVPEEEEIPVYRNMEETEPKVFRNLKETEPRSYQDEEISESDLKETDVETQEHFSDMNGLDTQIEMTQTKNADSYRESEKTDAGSHPAEQKKDDSDDLMQEASAAESDQKGFQKSVWNEAAEAARARGPAVISVSREEKTAPGGRHYPVHGHSPRIVQKSGGIEVEDGLYLFVTKNDPNCMMVKNMMQGRIYSLIDAYGNSQLRRAMKIRQVPTLISIYDGGMERYVGVTAIRNFLESTDRVRR